LRTESSTLQRAVLAGAALLVCLLYLADLNGIGLVSKDEPRYADIGRTMARTGDLITPRLWGEPWFEKPPLLYWMIAAGFKAGLGPELAPRLPVALLSLAFLLFFHNRLRRLWDLRVATFSTAMLATTAGWVALSGVAITDIPLAVFFTSAVLLAIDDCPRLTAAAASLGFAVLAKSLVPLVLFVPVLALDYRRIREWLKPGPILVFLAIAVPWHLVCYLRNGKEFLSVLFIQQQFGRFFSAERQHGQPWWFYGPALLLLLYPWFPLLVLAASGRDWRNRRVRTLLAVVIFGFLFFSKSENKLPSYLLPLVPSASILMGTGLARLRRPEVWMVVPIALLGLVPAAARVLPVALATGIRAAAIPWREIVLDCSVACLVGVILAAFVKKRAVAAAFVLCTAGFLCLKTAAYPELDRAATARPEWLAGHPGCIENNERGTVYGLEYYAERALPVCVHLDPTPARVVR